MNADVSDAPTRATEPAPDRRTALRAMGAAAFGAILATPQAAAARKGGKKRRNRNKGRIRCKRQVGPCRAFVIAECGDDQECKDTFVRCCDFLARCKAGGALRCFFPTPDER